jgi:hypothetical protein
LKNRTKVWTKTRLTICRILTPSPSFQSFGRNRKKSFLLSYQEILLLPGNTKREVSLYQ